MAVVVGTVTVLAAAETPYRQAIMPAHLTGTFSTQDTNDNQFKFAGRGKGRITLCVDNAPNKSADIKIYGMHVVTGAIGDAGTFVIDTAQSVALAAKWYESLADVFPFYLVQITHTASPTDAPAKAVTFYADLVEG